MAIRPVLRMGDPRLWQRSSPVADQDWDALPALLRDMLDTMRAYNGAGIAAPQVGVPKRVVMFEVAGSHPRYPDAEAVPLTVLVNPQIESAGTGTCDEWEGCLSVPGMRGLVTRPERVRYRAMTPQRDVLEREVGGFHARVVQHEVDHLDGILYPLRVTDVRNFGFEDDLFPDGYSRARAAAAED